MDASTHHDSAERPSSAPVDAQEELVTFANDYRDAFNELAAAQAETVSQRRRGHVDVSCWQDWNRA